MEHSQLIELIRTLTTSEIEQMRQFTSNSFFNNGKMKDQVILLLEICLSFSWDNVEQKLEKKDVFTSIFLNQPFVDGKLEKVMVEAHKVVRAFFLVQRYFREENEFHQILDFAEEVRSRGLVSRYHKLIDKVQRLQEESVHSAQYFHRQFLLQYSKCDEESIRNQAKGDLNIHNTIEALELDYYHNRLVLLNQLLLQKKITNLDLPDVINPLLEENQVPARHLEKSASIKINQEIFNLLKKKYPSPPEVQSLFDLLQLYEKELDEKSLHEFYTYLRNLCVLTISADYEQTEMENMLHKLYKDNLERGFLHYKGKINRSRYWALAINALNVKEFDWALNFINRYKHEIREENETQDIYRLNLANYLFRTGDFLACLDNIPSTTPFVDYLMVGKRLELKALYELHYDLLPYKLDAFKMFLSRTSQKLLSDEQRQMNSDFVNLLHQLINSNPGDPKRSELLIKRIQEKKQSAEWRWLIEKAKALRSK